MVSAQLEDITGVCGQSPAGSRGRVHGGGSGAKSHHEFVHFHTKERAEVKDLNDSWLPCPRQTASHSHDFWSVEGGGEVLTPVSTFAQQRLSGVSLCTEHSRTCKLPVGCNTLHASVSE